MGDGSVSVHDDVLELPGVLAVPPLLDQLVRLVLQRVPVGVVPSDWADVLVLHLQTTPVVHLVRLHQPSLRVLQRPHHSRQHSRGHLEGSCVLVRHSLPGGLDVQLRAVPVCVLFVAVEQHSQLVHASDHLPLKDLPVGAFGGTTAAEGVETGGDCVFAGVVGVVAGGPEDHLAFLTHREEVSDRDGLVVSDQEAQLRPRSRTPALDHHVHAWLTEVDGGLAAVPVLLGVPGHPLLVSAPAQLRGLVVALSDEPVHRPGVPEGAHRFEVIAALGIPLSNMDPLHSEVLHQQSPLPAGAGLFVHGKLQVTGQVDECLLDEPTDHAGVGPTARDGSGLEVVLADIVEEVLPEAVVAPLDQFHLLVGVVALPLFLDSVDVEHPFLLAVLDDLPG